MALTFRWFHRPCLFPSSSFSSRSTTAYILLYSRINRFHHSRCGATVKFASTLLVLHHVRIIGLWLTAEYGPRRKSSIDRHDTHIISSKCLNYWLHPFGVDVWFCFDPELQRLHQSKLRIFSHTTMQYTWHGHTW